MQRRSLLVSGWLALLALSTTYRAANAVAKGDAAPGARPNLLVILADDLGYGDLACYGARDMRTPYLDGLAAAGIRFGHFYANSPVCSPSRAALLTGRYPDLVGVPGVIRSEPGNSFGFLAGDAVLLPAVLKRTGYDTRLIGKWHLGLEPPNTPTDRGFNHFEGFLGDLLDDYTTHVSHGENCLLLDHRPVDPHGHATDVFTRWAVDYIRGRAGNQRPFFLELAYNAPHSPVQPSAEWLRRVQEREPGLNARRARLVAMIEQMDDGIGRVVAALKATGQYRNTLLVFASDNGGLLRNGASNGPLRGSKGQMNEGGIRVPMLAVWPGRIPAGSRSEQVTMMMDLFPTLCEAGGLKPPGPIDGVSLLPALLGKARSAADPERVLFWVMRESAAGGGVSEQGPWVVRYAARRGPWKLIRNGANGVSRLVNLEQDPQEESNVADQHPVEFDALSRALEAHIQKAAAVPWSPPGSPIEGSRLLDRSP